jgi:prevent-host-death family protein
MKTATFTDLRQNLKKYFDSVIDDSDTVIINREGGSGIVIMSLDEYNSLIETEYIMSSTETMKRIKDGAQSITEGRGKRIKSVDELIDFADKL